MIPALFRDWNDELRRNGGGWPAPAPTLAHRASHFPSLYAGAPPARGMAAGPTACNGYRYSLLRITCGDVADLADQQQIVIPVPGAAPVRLEVERTAGYTPTAGYTTIDLTTAATPAAVALELAAALDLEPAVLSGRLRRFDSPALRSVDLVARDPFVANCRGITVTALAPFTQALRFGAGAGHRDPWRVVRTGCHQHRRWIRCLVRTEVGGGQV